MINFPPMVNGPAAGRVSPAYARSLARSKPTLG
jgi:hypothetical protein